MPKSSQNYRDLEVYLKRCQKDWEERAKKLRKVAQNYEEIRNRLKPVYESQQQVHEVLNQSLPNKEKLRDVIIQFKVLDIDTSGLFDLANKITELKKSIEKSITRFHETFKQLPPRTKEALHLLAQQGWYLDLEMSIPDWGKLKEASSEGKVEEVQEALISYFEARLDEIEAFIKEQFPRRAHLIESAFKAHRRGEYELCIPVLIAQVDGICENATGYSFFTRRSPEEPKTANYVEQTAHDTFLGALATPLTKIAPIHLNQRERSESFNQLNRHMVMHGESIDYGTKTNSLKAISLINYISQVLVEFEVIKSN